MLSAKDSVNASKARKSLMIEDIIDSLLHNALLEYLFAKPLACTTKTNVLKLVPSFTIEKKGHLCLHPLRQYFIIHSFGIAMMLH